MKTTYLVWKDPSCNGINPDWQEITGQEFYALVNTPENKERRFIKLNSASEDGSDGEIVMESTETAYIAWRKEKRHKQHLRDTDPGYQIVSYHATETENGCSCEDSLPDESCDVEAECVRIFEHEEVRAAIARLSEDERQMVKYFYLSEKQGTERGYSTLTGIPQKTVHNRKIAVLNKLKKFIEN